MGLQYTNHTKSTKAVYLSHKKRRSHFVCLLSAHMINFHIDIMYAWREVKTEKCFCGDRRLCRRTVCSIVTLLRCVFSSIFMNHIYPNTVIFVSLYLVSHHFIFSCYILLHSIRCFVVICFVSLFHCANVKPSRFYFRMYKSCKTAIFFTFFLSLSLLHKTSGSVFSTTLNITSVIFELT